MTQESLTDLNNNTLIGYLSKRAGGAWHRDDTLQVEPNHYEFEVPVEDVRRRLFAWQALEGELSSTVLTEDGVILSVSEEFKSIVRSDNGFILGIFKQGYRPHQYDEWLVTNVEHILDADLKIGSAGVLKQGRQAWVQIELPETMLVDTADGVAVEYSPFLTAATSLDGSLSTTYLQGANVVVCDNTLSVALTQKHDRVKIKHSRNSLGRTLEVREALSLVHQSGDVFAEQVTQLSAQSVGEQQWAEFVKAYTYPGPNPSERSKTMAGNKVASLTRLWKHDARVAPFAGSAFGVVQAVNTFTHWEQNVKGDRAERNASLSITGGFDRVDAGTLALLSRV